MEFSHPRHRQLRYRQIESENGGHPDHLHRSVFAWSWDEGVYANYVEKKEKKSLSHEHSVKDILALANLQ